MARRTIGRRYRCDNSECEKYHLTWVTPVDKTTTKCVCETTPTFIGYVEEEL